MRSESKFFLVRNAKKLVRRKRVEDIIAENLAEASKGEGLKRSLTALDLIAYGIGATVGAGLFVVTGEAAKTLAGPSVSLSFVVAAVSGLLSAFCYAEFATRIPVAGGAYAYSYVCFGEAIAWLVGWNLTLEYGMSASVVARGFADYLVSFLQAVGIEAPFWFNNIPLDIPFVSKNGSVLASFVVLLCTGALLLGASESARLNVIITVLNMALILFIVVAGFSEVDRANYTPFFANGAGGVATGAGFVFFSYVGFDCICILAEELKNPKKDLPIAIVGTLLVVAILYVAVSLVLTGMVPYQEIDLAAPLSSAFMQNGMRWAAIIVAFGTTTILTSTTLCSLFGQPRVFFAMAKDGLVPQKLAKLNPRTKVPEFSTILCGVISAILAFALDINSLAGMISAGTMLSFTMVSLGILVIRYEDVPDSGNRKSKRFYKKHTFWLTVFFILNVVLGVVMNYFQDCPLLLVIFLSALTLAPICVLACFPQQEVNGSKRQARDQEDAAGEENIFNGEIFACPWVPWIPALAVVVNIHLILSLETEVLVKVALWAALGYFFYFVYGFHNSKLNNHTSYHTL
jgi:APA family basic amino acid/polyamine antiporter